MVPAVRDQHDSERESEDQRGDVELVHGSPWVRASRTDSRGRAPTWSAGPVALDRVARASSCGARGRAMGDPRRVTGGEHRGDRRHSSSTRSSLTLAVETRSALAQHAAPAAFGELTEHGAPVDLPVPDSDDLHVRAKRRVPRLGVGRRHDGDSRPEQRRRMPRLRLTSTIVGTGDRPCGSHCPSTPKSA